MNLRCNDTLVRRHFKSGIISNLNIFKKLGLPGLFLHSFGLQYIVGPRLLKEECRLLGLYLVLDKNPIKPMCNKDKYEMIINIVSKSLCEMQNLQIL